MNSKPKFQITLQVPEQITSTKREERVIALAWVMREALKEATKQSHEHRLEITSRIVGEVIDTNFGNKSFAYRKGIFTEAQNLAANINAEIYESEEDFVQPEMEG